MADVEQKIISEYAKRLEDISVALIKICDMQPIRFYGKVYISLKADEKQEIEARVPHRVYGSIPKHHGAFL